MTIETTRSKYSLWIGYFQDDTRKHVADGNRGRNVLKTGKKESITIQAIPCNRPKCLF